MMRMTPMQKMIGAVAVSVAAVAAAGGVFLWLAFSVAREGLARGAISSRIRDMAEERALARAASAVAEARAGDLARIRGFFINRKKPLAWVEFLEASARAAGNSIALALDEGAGDALIFRATLEGTPESILRALRAWEAAPYAFSPEDFIFQKLPAQSSGVLPAYPARLIITIRAITL